MNKRPSTTARRAAALLLGLAAAALAGGVLASRDGDRERDHDDRGRDRVNAMAGTNTTTKASAKAIAAPPAYAQECGACHVAYPAKLLPAASWQRLLGNLPQHFGTDASLDAATQASLSSWLLASAGASRRAREAPPQDRITRASWFVHEHDEISAATFKRASVKSASNCNACHARADQGVFDEHDVRIPR